MGVIINYSGRLKKASDLALLIDEVRDIAIGHDWEYEVFLEQFQNDIFSNELDLEKLYGIMITSEHSEPLSFSFLSDGRMCGMQNFKLLLMEEYIAANHVFTMSIDTLYFGFEIHKQLIIILDYISKKYIKDFKCLDEGQYWETRNEELLKEIFQKKEDYVKRCENSFKTIPQDDDESDEDYIYRIANLIYKEQNNIEKALPCLSLEEEYNLIKIRNKIAEEIESSAVNTKFLEFKKSPLFMNPELLEQEHIKARKITIYELIGKPDYKKSKDLLPLELEKELKKFLKILDKKSIAVEMWFDYPDENILFYDFLTNQVFQEEIAEDFLEIYPYEFIYENYYPNHPEEIHATSYDFWKDFLNTLRPFFDLIHMQPLDNAEEVIAFRAVYSEFREIKIIVNNVKYVPGAERAFADVSVEFEGINSKNSKVNFKYNSALELIYEESNNIWTVVKVGLPK